MAILTQAHQDNRYFMLSGFISFIIFFIAVALFAIVVFHQSEVQTFALQKDNYISVSLDTDVLSPTKSDAKSEPKPTPVEKPKPIKEQESVTEVESTPEPVETDVSTLFDDVWTQSADTKVLDKEKKIDAKRLAAIEKRIKVKSSTKSQKASETLKQLELVKPSIEMTGSSKSTAPVVNEYLAKIHAKVKSLFYPPASTEGESAKVRITLDAYGSLIRYRVLVRSGSTLFNEEVNRLKQRLKQVKFPENPDHQSVTLNIILTVEDR